MKKNKVIIIVVLSLIAVGIYLFNNQSKLIPKSRIDQILFSNSSQRTFFAWDRFVTIHLITNDKNAEKSVKNVINEINQIVGYNKVTLGSLDTAQIVIITSGVGFIEFSIEYKRLFEHWYGAEQLKIWDKIGSFNFPYNETHQCFGFGLYDPQNYVKSDYINKNRPHKFMIAIGNMKTLTDETLLGCAREEIAHAVFFIRDFTIENPEFSIFNSNAINGAIETYSQFDRELMYYMANTPSIVCKPRLDVNQLINENLPHYFK